MAAAVVLVLVVREPALPVLALGAAAGIAARARRDVTAREVWEAVDPPSLAGVFAIAVALGALARSWDGPALLMARSGAAVTVALGALAAVALNNLPAAVLLSARPPSRPRALLLGLDLGPNLAVSGSLSALIWFRAARRVGARPSVARVSRLGIVLVPLSLAAAGAALWLSGQV